jgi:hypothetical protein
VTCKELIDRLTALDSPDLEVLLNWEGQLVPARCALVENAHKYSATSTTISVDYYPEIPEDDDGAKFRFVYID